MNDFNEDADGHGCFRRKMNFPFCNCARYILILLLSKDFLIQIWKSKINDSAEEEK